MAQSGGANYQASWTGFLIVAFGALGLIGAFGTYAAQLPFDRAMARSGTLDQVLLAAKTQDPQKAEAALRPLLGESADRVLSGSAPIETRVATERARIFTEMHDEASIYGFRLRCYIAVFTLMASVFGAMVMSFGRS